MSMLLMEANHTEQQLNPNNFMTILKLDTVNNIISGTFQFDAINENDDTDTIKIREGRFDVKFTY
jgi:hypothetical protein